MARFKTLVKCFTWKNSERDIVTLGTGTRLDPVDHKAKLAADLDGLFSTAADLFVKSRLTTPLSVRRWTGFQAKIIHFGDPDNPTVQVTGAQFRLDDGTDERYWDGGAWAVAGASDWNTEQEIVDNITSWDVATLGRSMRVVVNLSTSDARFTPELCVVNMLYEAQIEFQEDIIFRSLVPSLRNTVRPIGRTVFLAPATGTVFNLEAVEIDTPYNFVDVDSVYDGTNDPDKLTDLFLSYNPGTKDVTLSSPITAGDQVWINFIYEPEVAVSTSQDFNEGEKVPQLVITEIEFNGKELQQDDSVADKAAKTTTVVPAPVQGDMLFTLEAITDKELDKQRLIEEVARYMYNNPILTSTGLDEDYRLWMLSEFEDVTIINQKELKSAEATFAIRNFRMWLKDPFQENIATGAAPGALPGGILALNQRGSAVEGLGGWTWAYDGLGFFPAPNLRLWGMDLFGKNFARLFGEGAFTQNVSTAPLAVGGLGILRANKAIRADDTAVGFFQDRDLDDSVPHNFPNPGSQDIHVRAIVRDPFNQGGSGVTAATYLDIQDVGGSRMMLSSDPGTDDYNLEYGSYSETISTAPGVVDAWTLIDFQVRPTDPTTQVELFVNGVDYTSSITQPGSLVADAFTSNPALALFNTLVPAVTTAGLNVQLAFLGIAVGRTISFTRHTADAQGLELIP